VERMAFVYEPEGAIGQAAPVTPEQAAAGCRAIPFWLAVHYGLEIAEGVRIIYGGSVTHEHAAALLSDPDVDGLGATPGEGPRRLRQKIVATIAQRGKG
ncbi:MAG: triose-phosphate isomerase, partial [Anaerolineae bacterium]|nr:triose-phosphate isomerase [Anaerolineae bacterium]